MQMHQNRSTGPWLYENAWEFFFFIILFMTRFALATRFFLRLQPQLFPIILIATKVYSTVFNA